MWRQCRLAPSKYGIIVAIIEGATEMNVSRRSFLADAVLAFAASAADAGRVRFDFDNGSLQGWEVVEGAFEKVVTDRATEYNPRRPLAKSGTWFLSTLESFSGKPEAGPTGVVESPTVRIDGREVSFWSGGGKIGVHFALIDR